MDSFISRAKDVEINVNARLVFETRFDTEGIATTIAYLKESHVNIVVFYAKKDDVLALLAYAKLEGVFADDRWIFLGSEGLFFGAGDNFEANLDRYLLDIGSTFSKKR
eukprot:TRINITY_DN1918_c0_g4_i2.p2 TRINITY_DN1918_c0_g4~~TRINITY_DN1918_c0_g4_i2.p2  ORF type:complete len:108 (+),score=28.48 TRINITY_DN1918_c0_g4_i2:1067-1390(+)